MTVHDKGSEMSESSATSAGPSRRIVLSTAAVGAAAGFILGADAVRPVQEGGPRARLHPRGPVQEMRVLRYLVGVVGTAGVAASAVFNAVSDTLPESRAAGLRGMSGAYAAAAQAFQDCAVSNLGGNHRALVEVREPIAEELAGMANGLGGQETATMKDLLALGRYVQAFSEAWSRRQAAEAVGDAEWADLHLASMEELSLTLARRVGVVGDANGQMLSMVRGSSAGAVAQLEVEFRKQGGAVSWLTASGTWTFGITRSQAALS